MLVQMGRPAMVTRLSNALDSGQPVQNGHRPHLRSHIAFLHWAIRFRVGREILGQLLRIAAAGLFTWLWMPHGNTSGTTMGAFRSAPIPRDLRRWVA